MRFTRTDVEGVVVVDIEPRADDRGFFARTFCFSEFASEGLVTTFVQSNMSWNPRARTLRGLHWQTEPHGEAKLLRCIAGRVLEVAVDLRRESPTYLKWSAVELSRESRRALYVPPGCANGYLTLCDDSEVHYMTSSPYAASHERGVRWDDPAFAIDWPFKEGLIVSEKDRSHPLWNDPSTIVS